MAKTTTINFANGTSLISETLNLFACGDFMRVTNTETKKQEMIPAASITSIIEQGEAGKSQDIAENVVIYTNTGKMTKVAGSALSNNGSFLSIADDRKGTRTWLPSHAINEVMIVSKERPYGGDTAKVTFADRNEPITYRNAWVNPTGNFVYISREAEGLSSWFTASSITNIEFLS
ncbi:hypothetical protein L3V16_21040 [Brucella ciceri]|uniref:hypothetical protein n=1 Tax=Brucella ciceri TaxID=391287 RepID=UPI001F141A52|nr:hypothetical protein [Brucella ciceri]MCH6206313.1 hypothetical protein [Brucella ciceri]